MKLPLLVLSSLEFKLITVKVRSHYQKLHLREIRSINMNQNLRYDHQGLVMIYIDGCCLNNGYHGAQAGYGVWFNYDHPLNVWAPVRGAPPTNNNAEIQAATQAIRQASKIGITEVKLITDSQFLINCMTQWIDVWRQNNWHTADGMPVKNKRSLVDLDNAINNYMDRVVWEYVEAHKGIQGNMEADALAKKGAAMYSY